MKTRPLIITLSCVFFSTTLSFAEPLNLEIAKQNIKSYHDSGAYEQELEHTLQPAARYIIQRAKANQQASHHQKLALVLDIDETSLTNYNNMVARGFTYDKKKWHDYLMQANAPVIHPMLSLYNTAKKYHVAVFFVTGRHQSEKKATEKNLNLAGYHGWTGLYLRPDDDKQTSIIPFKVGARAEISKHGYTIIASIGDQQSDLQGGYAEKMVKLPNPYYLIP